MRIKLAIAGVGNCASSLVQGIEMSRRGSLPGVMHQELGGYTAADVEVVCAFDVDQRKVGRPLTDALRAPPNNTANFFDLPQGGGPVVLMGPVLDGVAQHTTAYPVHQRVVIATQTSVDLASSLRKSGAKVLVNYMPVGAQRATETYARACLEAGVALVNAVPCFIVSDPDWARRFHERRLPCIGDDIKAQVGATILHRSLVRLLRDRGVRVVNTYQLNVGGNTDFLNMLSRDRLASKRVSKTRAVQSQLDQPLEDDHIHVGPSDHVPWLKDNKVCFLRIEGEVFGGMTMNIEARLSVEDSPNSAAVVLDAILATQIAIDRGEAGPIEPACAWCMKHPPAQLDDSVALQAFERWVAG